MLCERCRERAKRCPELLPEHVVSMPGAASAGAWWIDPWGRAHPVGSTAGRLAGHCPQLLDASVSREHAGVRRTRTGWEIRDCGSKNGTWVDDRRVIGRAPLVDRSSVVFGRVPLVFRTRPPAVSSIAAPSTAACSGAAVPQLALEDRRGRQLVIAGEPGADGHATVLARCSSEGDWTEVHLTGLELALLHALALRAGARHGERTGVGHCIETRELARRLPFRSGAADEDNVRHLVCRLRAGLRAIGIDDLIEVDPPHGYRVAWAVNRV
jgi:hypothetical protein